MLESPRAARAPSSDAWLEALRSTGAQRDQAILDLYALLLRAARFEVGRRRPASVAMSASTG